MLAVFRLLGLPYTMMRLYAQSGQSLVLFFTVRLSPFNDGRRCPCPSFAGSIQIRITEILSIVRKEVSLGARMRLRQVIEPDCAFAHAANRLESDAMRRRICIPE